MNDALMTAVNRCISRLVLRGWSVPSEREPGVLHVHAAASRTKSRCYIHIAERDQPDLVTLAVGEGLLNDERDLRIARAVSTMLPSEGLTGRVGFRPDIGAYLLVGLLPQGAGHVPEGESAMTATIDFHHGTFYVSVFRATQRVEYRRGGYRDVIAFAVGMGVPRREVTLTPAAQSAAMGVAR